MRSDKILIVLWHEWQNWYKWYLILICNCEILKYDLNPEDCILDCSEWLFGDM